MTEIKYGRILRNGRIIGYAVYEDEGNVVELFAAPNEPLEAKINGVPVPINGQMVMVWTRVAGLLGQDEVLARNKSRVREYPRR